jgi:hypothetical protein
MRLRLASHLLALIGAACLQAAPGTASPLAPAAVIADMSDAAGDDSGPGAYTYPANSVFVPGCFDLTRLKVTDNGTTVRFEFTISGSLTNPWGSPSGFSLQSIDLYMDIDGATGSGALWTPEARNAVFSDEAGWERLLWVAPEFDGFKSGVFSPDGSYTSAGVTVSVDAGTRRIIVDAPKSRFPGISTATRYLALMLGQDGYSPGRVRPVEAAGGEWVFGGGASGNADPNVMDLLGAPGLSQGGLLGAYDPSTGVQPVLFFAPDAQAPSLAHTPPEAVLRAAPLLDVEAADRAVESAVLYARRRGAGAFDSTSLERTSVPEPGRFVFAGAPAAAAVAGDTIEYYFRATDGLQASRLPGGSALFAAPVDSVSPPPPERRLDVVFLFHANQNLVPYSKVGDEACYRGLIEVLRRHPQSRFMLHVSGTLLHSLAWLRPQTLDLLRAGIAEGQFEIVGSTYAQNIMYSTRVDTSDTEMNRRQIREHRRILRSLLEVEPVSFWNAERVWTQSFASLLREEGYLYGQIEDYAMLRSGAAASEYVLRTTRHGSDTLVVFDDDKQFQGYVNGAIDSGDDSGLLNFLAALYAEDTQDRYAVCYHEDAEATGLWDYEGGGDHEANWDHLDALLTHLEARPWIRVTTYSEFAADHPVSEDLTPVADAAADWMGRDAWFALNESAAFDAYRALYDRIRDTLDVVEAEIAAHPGPDSASVALHDHAWWTLCAHQYEFGCAGMENTSNSAPWDLCRAALVTARAARLALDPYATRPPVAGDIDQDGVEDRLFAANGYAAVVSRRGGQLLYLFDLARGEQIVGPDNFFYYGEPYIANARYVPKLQGGVDVYPWLAGKPEIGDLFTSTYEIRRRAFLDVLTTGSGTTYLRDADFTLTGDASSVTATRTTGGITVSKRFSMLSDGVRAGYTLSATGSASGSIAIESGLSPDHRAAVDGGRWTLRYTDGQDTSSVVTQATTGVVNLATGRAALLGFSANGTTLSGEEDVFGLELNANVPFAIAPGSPASITADLRAPRASILDAGEPEAPGSPGARLVAAPVPSRASVRLTFEGMPDGGRGALLVFDARGRLVRRLAAGTLPSSCLWDLKDGAGRPVSSGAYFARAATPQGTFTAKIVVAP